MVTSEAQRRAVKNYQSKKKRISLEIEKEIYPVWKSCADELGISLTAFIKEAVYAKIEQGR